MQIELISATQVVAYADKPDCVELIAEFSHLPGQAIPFVASLHDPEAHGQDIYHRAMAGEFGEIDYRDCHPTSQAQSRHAAMMMDPSVAGSTTFAEEVGLCASTDNISHRQRELLRATTQAQHWDMMGDAPQADAYRRYYQAIYALESEPDWPLSVAWPQPPA